MKRLLTTITLALLCLAPFARGQNGQTVTVSSSLLGGFQQMNGTITFTPTDCTAAAGHVSAFISSGGQSSQQPLTAPVVNGAFTLSHLVDTSTSNPQHFGYAVTLRGTNGLQLLGPGYSCVQPGSGPEESSWCSTTGGVTTCNFDFYQPNVATLPILGLGFNGGTVHNPATFASTLTLSADPVANLQAATKHYVDAAVAGASSGTTFTGGTVVNPTTFDAAVTLPGDPASALQAATKQYVDAHAGGATFTGGAVTSPIVLPGNPTSNLQAAPKQYVDSQSAAAVAFASQFSYPGSIILTDSIGCGEGSSSFSGSIGSSDVGSNGVPNGGWAWLVGEQLGPLSSINNLCQGGAEMSTIITAHMLLSTNPQYAQQPTAFASGGINDNSAYGSGANALTNYVAQIEAITAWMTTPASAKVMAANCTQTPHATGSIQANTLGNVQGLKFTQSGDFISCSITSTGGPLAVVYRVIDSNTTGTATLTIDGTSEGTLTSSGAGGQAITGEFAPQTEFAKTFTVAPGTHTVVLTGTMTAGVFGVDYVTTTYSGPAVVGSPRLVWVGIPHWLPDDTGTGTYDTTMQGTVATLAAQGWPVTYANVRGEMNATTDVSASSTTCRDGSSTSGSTEANHPNDCGYMAMRDVALRTVAANPLSYFQGGAPSAGSGEVPVDGTFLSGTLTFDPFGFDLAYITGNATISLAAAHTSGVGGMEQKFTLVNYGANTVTLTGDSAAKPIVTPGGNYCPSGCPNTAYSLAANHSITFISNNGGWIVVSDVSHP